jgi:hypothetical protein
MLKILIEQKKYIEAYKIYKELIKENSIENPSIYSDLVAKVRQIDPILTMNREQKIKVAEKLERILNRIRQMRKMPRKMVQTLEPKVPHQEITSIPEKPSSDFKEPPKEAVSSLTPFNMLKAIEDFTASSINSIMKLICGNFSNEILAKKPKADRIEILQEMLRRIEVLKNQRRKELSNV